MAVLGRLLISSAQRLDLPDLLSIDSYAAGDFKYLLKGLVNDTKPYILKGFDVIDPASAIGAQTCSIRISDSSVFYPGSNAGPFFYGLPEGDPNAQPLVPELRKNAVNYVYLTFTTFNTSADSKAFWDPDKGSGAGGEFPQDVNTESVLTCQVNVSVGAFPANTIPIAKITVGAVVITAIEDARDMLFRLGSGGINPNPYANYSWSSLPNSSYQRSEPPTTMMAGGVNPFEGADKNILSLKDWMDAIMTKLKELGGTTHWYDDISTFSLINSFIDSSATLIQSKGNWVHSSATSGLISWTEDIEVKSAADPREFILSGPSNIQLANNQVAYLSLVRNQIINVANSPVSFVNGATYINTVGGSVGLFANLAIGDYVKSVSDINQNFVEVVQFWDSINASGSITTAALAKSISIATPYSGSTLNNSAVFDRGVYTSGDVTVSDRSAAPLATAGGNFFWLGFRTDNVETISNIATTSLNITVNTNDGTKALVTSSSAHGLSDSQRVTITGTTNYNGTYQVEVASTTTFYIPVSAIFSVPQSGSAFYATVTTALNHGFPTDATVNITGTTNYNGAYPIAVVDATHLQIPVGASAATETSGTVTLAGVIVRRQNGAFTLYQGQSIAVDGTFLQSVPSFVGQTPDYALPPGYNTLAGTENFNSLAADTVSVRLSKLTGMMADKAQDKTIKYLPTGLTLVGNTTNGSNQEITFDSGSTLTILQPGSPGNATITLPSVSPGISLAVNQSAYVTIDRNASSTPSIVVANTALIPVAENTFVIAERLSGTAIYLWNGTEFLIGTTPLSGSGSGIQKVNLYDPLSTTLPLGLITIDSVSVTAGMHVLFSNLSSNNNEIYQANGVGTTITSWTAQFAFAGSVSPSGGDFVVVTQGQGFANQLGEFNGTTWVYNNTVRHFNGVDYWEQSALVTSTLADNTTNGTVFSVNFAGSENMIVDYSIVRGSLKETASLYITTDGTNVSVTDGGANLNGPSGISFDGIISGSLIVLRYTTTSTGTAASMKYSIKRWSDSAGGPGGIPSYSGGGGSGVTSLNGLAGALTLVAGSNITITPLGGNITIASTGGGGTPAGPTNSIQYNNAGSFAGNSNFEIDVANNALNLNGLNQTILSSGITIVDNTASPATLFTYNAATFPFGIIEYSIIRSGNYRCGRMLVTTDGAVTGFNDDYVDTALTGVNLTATIVGPNVSINYTSTNIGFNGTFKYSMRKWS